MNSTNKDNEKDFKDDDNLNENFKPFVSAEKDLPDLTITSIIIGIILAVIFGAANAYLGLRVGMTVSASIPAAVLSMGIIRVILKRDSILESNMVQTIGSAGESVAAGAIFTIPALFLWADELNTNKPSFFEIAVIAFFAGILGICFMVPLRKALIVKEHKNLPYPEGTACAEVLLAGEKKSSKASIVFKGLGIAAAYKFIADGLKLFLSEPHYEVKKFGTGIGVNILPALLGVGYICGATISSYMLAGGIIGWLVIIPIIKLFGSNSILFPATSPISELNSFEIWSNYIKYIGAGAVAAGGIISLIKSFPLIINTFIKTIKGYKENENYDKYNRLDQDISIKVILLVIIAVTIVIWLLPIIPVNLISAVIIVIFGFFFATVSSRLVGLVGSSNNPVSGMTIATLLLTTFILRAFGIKGIKGMTAAIVVGSIICIITAIAGDTSQDLKTGYILGATPKRQQYGEIIGVAATSLVIGGVIYLLNSAWKYGSNELPAPQATLMKMVVEGVMEGNLPWTMVISGAFIAIVIEILRIPVLPVAVGLYLPIHLSVGIMAGGLIKMYADKKSKSFIENGILYSSGMIAGEGLIGILLAIFAIIKIKNQNLLEIIDLSEKFKIISKSNIFAIIVFLILVYSVFYFSKEKK